MEKRRIIIWVLIGVISAVLLGLILAGIWNASPYYSDVVTDYSDAAPRVGNNLYGYIDVPEGFVMAGSFDAGNDNYAGGKDGVREGVHLYNSAETVCFSISLLTPDRGQEDYIGMGREYYFTYDKKERNMTADKAGIHIAEGLLKNNLPVRENSKDRGVVEGSPIEINGLAGEEYQWDSIESDKTWHNQIYLLENPEKKNVIHCITVTYQKGQEKYLDYLQTFSLTRGKQAGTSISGAGKRVGSDATGYMNIPEGYDDYHGWLIYEWLDDRKKSSELSCYAEKERIEKGIALNESMLMGSFTKNDEYDQNLISYMEKNFSEVFGQFDVLDYADFSSVKLKGEETEFGAQAFVSVMEQCLSEQGTYTYSPVAVAGNQGYKVTWSGRSPVDNQMSYFSFYILDNAKDSNVVYIVGARDKNGEGKFWKYLDSFSGEK